MINQVLSSAPSTASVNAAWPPAMSPTTNSGCVPNVGGHSEASSTPSRPEVLASLPFIKLAPTGGVGPENAREFLEAGAVAVGIGGNLVSHKLVAAGAFDQINETARTCVQAVQGI